MRAAPTAQAQHQEDEARRAFRDGTEAAATERWADSEQAFRRAFELSHAGSALFNQAIALRALGRHVEAHEAFARLLADFPELSPELRASVERLARESRARIAIVELHGLALTPHLVTIDGRHTPDSLARPLRIELDEGAHELVIERPEHATFTWHEQAAGGEVYEVRVSLPLQKADTENHSKAATRSRARTWWWIGGVTAVVAAGVGATLVTLRATEDGTQVSPRTPTVYEVP